MAARYDILATSTYMNGSVEKTKFTKIGVAFPMKGKDGFSLKFDALPITPNVIIMPAKPTNRDHSDPSFDPPPPTDDWTR